jgi:adenylosuccinate lyase
VTARIADSSMYRHLWATAQARAVFDEEARLQGWLDVLVALATAQAAEGLIPEGAADRIRELARVDLLDLHEIAHQTRLTGHSTLGLIRALRQLLPDDVHPYVYVGATVQDVTDTWTSLVLKQIGGQVWSHLRRIEMLLLEIASTHRDTLIAGRTHGQAGAPVTFGWKAASWADEIGRHLERMAEGAPRWLVGQLGGGVGSLASTGAEGLSLRRRFCAELSLRDPGISWLTSRDRIAEFGSTLAMITGTLARVGTEVYELQRPEIAELREPSRQGMVGSITMPHKRNPERSEHLDTLARLVRANAGVLVEGMVSAHERDGRAWKAEWVALPEVCMLTCAALQTAEELLTGLEVDAAAMGANLGSYTSSERALALLSQRLGRHVAQERLQAVLAEGQAAGTSLTDALLRRRLLTPAEAASLAPDPGSCAPMVDSVVATARARREKESPTWP